ncbi:endolytic murein transglycosylase [bacterium MnTg02]|nr:endolytic murein transglycosylase [bacterium MnTg02]
MSHDDGFDWGGQSRKRARSGRSAQMRNVSSMARSPSESLEPSRAPEPAYRKQRRQLHPIFAFLNGLLSLLLVGLIGVGGLIYFLKFKFDQPGPLEHSTIVVIPRGEGTNAIATRLEREGIISDRRIFMASVRYFQFKKTKKIQAGIKAGEYEIHSKASMRKVLDALIDGRVIPHKLPIPEGLTSEQIVARLNSTPLLKGEITEIPPEGSLLPDTYLFSRNSPRKDLLGRMRTAQRRFLAKLWQGRASNLPFKTAEEALILASIVEKETGRSDERRKIAGVFINRMRRKIRLQSDPTIIYGLAGGKGTLGRPILRSEINKSTPYNTYQIDGLPPTPIANPGRAAIEAVLNPEETSDIYFVANGSGGHIFAATLKEHNRNVAKWRKIERVIRVRQAAARKATEAVAAVAAGPQPDSGATVAQGKPAATPESTASSALAPPPADGAAITGFPGLTVSGGGLAQMRLDVPHGTAIVAKQSQPIAVPPASETAAATAVSPNVIASDIPLPARKPRRN